MKILINTGIYDEEGYKVGQTEATVIADEDADIWGYLNVIKVALELETFSESVIIKGMRDMVKEYDEKHDR